MVNKITDGTLRVWWIPQIPGDSFYVEVESTSEAIKVIDVLEKYDTFQFENHIKPEYCNAGGLQVVEEGEWVEWETEMGENIDEVRERVAETVGE